MSTRIKKTTLPQAQKTKDRPNQKTDQTQYSESEEKSKLSFLPRFFADPYSFGRIEAFFSVKTMIFIFAVLFGILFFRLATYPNYFDSCVSYSVTQAVWDVFGEIQPTSESEVTWIWTPMYQHAGGRSPVYTGLIKAGLELFGLTLLGVRISTTILAFLSLLLLYYTLTKFFTKLFSVTFLVLFATAPWHVVMARSGSIVGFGMSLVLVAVCFTALLFAPKEGILADKRVHNLLLPIAAGVSVALLPYGHAGIRTIPIFILLGLLIFSYKVGFKRVAVSLLAAFSVAFVQLTNLKAATAAYFNARGEDILTQAKDHSPDDIMQYIIPKITENIKLMCDFFFGLNEPGHIFDVNIAHSYWRHDVVLFPKFLVPFLLAGIVWSLYHFFTRKKLIYLLPVLAFGITAIPGLMSGIGAPNQARLYIMVLPTYFLIAYALYHILKVCTSKKMNKLIFIGYSVLILATAAYQVNNFYHYEKGKYDDKTVVANHVMDYLNESWAENKDLKIIYREFPVFYVYSYVDLRWLGQENLDRQIKDGNIILVTDQNNSDVRKMLASKEADIFITVQDDVTADKYPEITEENYIREEQNRFVVYTAIDR